MLAFDIVQFFPLLNHQLLLLILDKVSFNLKISIFFQNYLVGRKTKYLQNSFSSPFFNVNVRVGQRSALFPILSALYLSPAIHIFEKIIKNLKIPISILSFVDNRLFILQNKLLVISNTNLFCSYNVISSLFGKFGLIMEYGKTEVFYFSRSQRVFNPPPLYLMPLEGPILCFKNTQQYLRFIFNCKLSFQQHINFYVTKAISTIKYMKMLGNSSRGLIPIQKKHLYRCYTLLIALYSF